MQVILVNPNNAFAHDTPEFLQKALSLIQPNFVSVLRGLERYIVEKGSIG